MTQPCPACGATWRDGETCEQLFHQLLFWEAEQPALGVVHHLMVLCYYLQHPSLYSPAGLRSAQMLLTQFLEEGLSPERVRQRNKHRVNSRQRKWKIKATVDAKGSYEHPPRWTMTVADVAAAGSARYCEMVQRWAEETHQTLKSFIPKT